MRKTMEAALVGAVGVLAAGPAWAGQVVLPEPGSMVLILMAAGGLLAARRLRR